MKQGEGLKAIFTHLFTVYLETDGQPDKALSRRDLSNSQREFLGATQSRDLLFQWPIVVHHLE